MNTRSLALAMKSKRKMQQLIHDENTVKSNFGNSEEHYFHSAVPKTFANPTGSEKQPAAEPKLKLSDIQERAGEYLTTVRARGSALYATGKSLIKENAGKTALLAASAGVAYVLTETETGRKILKGANLSVGAKSAKKPIRKAANQAITKSRKGKSKSKPKSAASIRH